MATKAKALTLLVVTVCSCATLHAGDVADVATIGERITRYEGQYKSCRGAMAVRESRVLSIYLFNVAREEFSAAYDRAGRRFRENLRSNPRMTCEAVGRTEKDNADFVRRAYSHYRPATKEWWHRQKWDWPGD